eukprot:1161083-Pelagomonas_calceolata.AAC.6
MGACLGVSAMRARVRAAGGVETNMQQIIPNFQGSGNELTTACDRYEQGGFQDGKHAVILLFPPSAQYKLGPAYVQTPHMCLAGCQSVPTSYKSVPLRQLWLLTPHPGAVAQHTR